MTQLRTRAPETFKKNHPFLFILRIYILNLKPQEHFPNKKHLKPTLAFPHSLIAFLYRFRNPLDTLETPPIKKRERYLVQIPFDMRSKLIDEPDPSFPFSHSPPLPVARLVIRSMRTPFRSANEETAPEDKILDQSGYFEMLDVFFFF